MGNDGVAKAGLSFGVSGPSDVINPKALRYSLHHQI